MMPRVGLCLVSLIGLSTLGAAAETPDSKDPPPKVMQPVRVQGTAVDYAADTAASTKTDTPLQDVPQSISVITRQVIDDLNTQNIGEAMLYVPGVGMAQGEGNRETPVIRGSSSTGDFFLDGMRDDVQYYRDLYNIQQIEVLKGPNGMLFGRGGVGGLINRVTKEAGWTSVRQLTAGYGTDDRKRTTADFDQPLSDNVALRVNGVYEDSDSYRDDVTLERYGVNPTLTVRAGDDTRVTFGAEYFHDERIADRGVSSFEGRPLDLDPATFIGDPAQSPVHATVKMGTALVEHRFGDSAVLRNRTRYADYDKFYQNVFAGAVDATGTQVAINAYNNAQQRRNFFNQTDLTFALNTGAIEHKLLAGMELGRQETENFRNTGFFDSVAFGTTAINVPIDDPRTTLPVTFRQGPTDADNEGTAKIAAVYVQDEVALSERFLATAGLRYDNFRVDFTNHRTATDFSTRDNLLSPRLGLVYKASDPVSLYASYSLTYQPRAGDQLASLSPTNESLDPEEFRNYEVGVKWDAMPDLALTAALFRLERENVAIPDPADPVNHSILVDGQRTQGMELGLTGNITERWSVIGAYAYQDGEIVSDQSATVLEGATLANLPKNTFSVWNRYDLSPMWGFGLGVLYRDDLFAATENLATPASNVTLPGYTRVDGAVFFAPGEHWRMQLNLENLLDEDYFQFANSNTNITPGSPRAAYLVLTASF